jgi:hypothetical protein
MHEHVVINPSIMADNVLTSFLPMNKTTSFFLAAAAISLAPCFAWGQLAGTTPVTTGGPSVVPTLVSGDPGTFLGQTFLSGGYLDFSNLTVVNFQLAEAIFRDGNGAIDIYLQLSTPAPNPGVPFPTEPIFQALAANFGSYATSVGYRLDGSTFALDGATLFKDGSIVPVSAERGLDNVGFGIHNNSVFFDFSGIGASSTSAVLVISTNASDFTTIGDLGVYSTASGNTTTSSLGYFSPAGAIVAAPAPVPEAGPTALLLALGVVGLFGAKRMIRSHATVEA